MTINAARIAVGQQMGLPDTFTGTMAEVNALTIDQKQTLTAALLAYILQRPGDFTPAQVATAAAEKGRIGTLAQEDAAVTLPQILAALEDEAQRVIGAPLATIGNGVSQALTLTGSILPVVVLAVVGIALFSFYKKTTTT